MKSSAALPPLCGRSRENLVLRRGRIMASHETPGVLEQGRQKLRRCISGLRGRGCSSPRDVRRPGQHGSLQHHRNKLRSHPRDVHATHVTPDTAEVGTTRGRPYQKVLPQCLACRGRGHPNAQREPCRPVAVYGYVEQDSLQVLAALEWTSPDEDLLPCIQTEPARTQTLLSGPQTELETAQKPFPPRPLPERRLWRDPRNQVESEDEAIG
mmetsp:Transcript_33380/g.92173  ORF Transcript_33380/g.92173 Transcript_33380/m.92173 type:complete len:211 (-) Transcript_33380:2657-3289(-)